MSVCSLHALRGSAAAGDRTKCRGQHFDTFGASESNAHLFLLCLSAYSSLTSDQGLDLMERLTHRLGVHAADLTQFSYVWSAARLPHLNCPPAHL